MKTNFLTFLASLVTIFTFAQTPCASGFAGNFPCDDYEYRIKPKPREWDVLFDTSHEAMFIRQEGEGERCWIKVREVIE